MAADLNMAGGMRTGEGGGRGARSRIRAGDTSPKKPVTWSAATREARDLVHAHRHRLALGLVLMLISRLSGLVLPYTSKLLIDEVIGNRRTDLLLDIAFFAGAATVVQAITSFALSQILGVA